MENISEKIIEKIKEEHIAPEPKWKFLLKNEFFWGSFVASILLGGISFGVVLDMVIDNDWDIYQNLHTSFFEFLLLMTPYFWIVFFALFFFLARYNYKHTKNSYRHSPYLVILISIFSSIVLGIFSYNFGLGKAMDAIFSDNVPYYPQMMHHRMIVWNQPERGLISGTIINFGNKNDFIIKNDQGEIWKIKCRDAFWRGGIIPELGIKIKVMGQMIHEKLFDCNEVRPWHGGGMMRGIGGGMMLDRK